MEMNSDSFSSQYNMEELKIIRKKLRRRNCGIVLTSLILAAALLIGTVQFAIPAVEKLYWYPEEQHFSSEDSYAPKSLYDPTSGDPGVTDLQITMQTYSELFCPEQRWLYSISSLRTGFAAYLLSVSREHTDGQVTTETLTLKKGQLQIPQGFWEYPPYFALRFLPEENRNLHMDVLKEQTQALPEYLSVSAYVTFQEDISVLDLLEFRESFIAGNVITKPQSTVLWMAVRHADPSDDSQILCGMSASGSVIRAPEMNKTYPGFDDFAAYEEKNLQCEILSVRAKILEERFVSLLRYSDDQLKAGRGIAVNGDEAYYENALAYVEENGVNVYGCYIVTTPQRICEMMQWDNIGCITPDQIWIN